MLGNLDFIFDHCQPDLGRHEVGCLILIPAFLIFLRCFLDFLACCLKPVDFGSLTFVDLGFWILNPGPCATRPAALSLLVLPNSRHWSFKTQHC